VTHQPTRQPGTTNHAYLAAVVAQVEGQLQVGQEVVGELGVHVEYLQDLLALDGVDVAVAERTHVRVGLARLGVQVDHLPEDVVLTWRREEGRFIAK